MDKSKKIPVVCPKPANDVYPRASPRLNLMTFLPLHNKRKLAASLAFAVLIVILLIACAAYFRHTNPTAAPPPPKLVPPAPA